MHWARAGLWLGLVGFVVARDAQAQGRAQTAAAAGYSGSWQAPTPAGGALTLVLTQNGAQIRGTLSGNGAQFEVEAQLGPDGGFYGTARSRAGTLFIGGELQGDQLGLALAEMTAQGVPDMRTAQEVRMTRAASGAGAGASAGAPGAARSDLAATPADQQVAQLLLSSPWCTMQYSQQMGATTVERVTFGRDGRFTSRTQRESAVNNSQGTYYGNSSDGVQGFWRVQGGSLMLSADGQRYEGTPLQISRNSNGYPIVTAAGKEYYQCN